MPADGARPCVYARLVKPAADRAAAAALLVLLSPLLAALAGAVWLTSGRPVFFTQARLGRGGRPFRIVKLRTLRAGAAAEYLPDGSTRVDGADPRLTPLGRLLRETSLDELPQLVNVLRGEMSLIGPRPDLVEQEALYDAEARQKLRVRPGITGLAQVSGRNALPWRERLRLDARYARQVSFRMDAWIAARTVSAALARRGVFPGGEAPP